ncbi:hypothetical protein TNCT_135031 [Trichonephila clavata]|uniref:Uncharacterized protein n=1 Tax=Trichonephila clavata TaxID=2740835 RepID=A0A8X6G4S6_TRICU|nr:hypothetical protein TNCT_135031 [Trichonephila clavata]
MLDINVPTPPNAVRYTKFPEQTQNRTLEGYRLFYPGNDSVVAHLPGSGVGRQWFKTCGSVSSHLPHFLHSLWGLGAQYLTIEGHQSEPSSVYKPPVGKPGVLAFGQEVGARSCHSDAVHHLSPARGVPGAKFLTQLEPVVKGLEDSSLLVAVSNSSPNDRVGEPSTKDQVTCCLLEALRATVQVLERRLVEVANSFSIDPLR